MREADLNIKWKNTFPVNTEVHPAEISQAREPFVENKIVRLYLRVFAAFPQKRKGATKIGKHARGYTSKLLQSAMHSHA